MKSRRVQVAPCLAGKELVAQTLHGKSWDEAASGRILERIDANAGPPMVDALSFLVPDEKSDVDLPRLAPIAPRLDPLVQFFVAAERRVCHAASLQRWSRQESRWRT